MTRPRRDKSAPPSLAVRVRVVESPDPILRQRLVRLLADLLADEDDARDKVRP